MQKRVRVFCKLVISWVIKGFSQPRTQAILRYLSYEKRLGTERETQGLAKNSQISEKKAQIISRGKSSVFCDDHEIFRTYGLTS